MTHPCRGFTGRSPAALVAAAILCACTGTPSPPPAPRVTASGVGGTILAVPETGASSAVVAFRLPEEVVSPVSTAKPIPTATYTVTHASAPDPAGGIDLLVTDSHDTASVFRVAANGDATQVGPPLPTTGPHGELSLAIGGGVAIVAGCPKIWMLSLAHPDSWRSVAEGCWAGIAPNGNSLLYSPDGAEILEKTLPDGKPRKLLDISSVASVVPGGSEPTLLGPPAWGQNGLAFTIATHDEVAVLVRTPAGRIQTVFHEARLNTSQLPRLAWQPGGRLLAIADDMGPSGGVLRLYDPSGQQLRAIGLDLLGFSEPLWSPDGRSLASLTSAKALIVFDENGDWRLRVETQWKDLLGWAG